MALFCDNRCHYCTGQQVAACCQLAVITSTTAQLFTRQTTRRPASTAFKLLEREKVAHLWFLQ
jgi:hypothetical protein